MKLFGLTSGRGLLSRRYALVAAAAVLVMYIAGSEWYSYFSTMSRMVSQEVGDRIPIQFEIERARTMIEDLIPDVKRNMVIIAEEEIGVTKPAGRSRSDPSPTGRRPRRNPEAPQRLGESKRHGTQRGSVGHPG